MSSMECATEPGHVFNDGQVAQSATDPAGKLRTRVFFGFGSAMALGLALAGWYVGGRILDAEQTPAQNELSVTIAAAEKHVPEVQPQTVVEPVRPVEVVPPAPQLFLEVAGLNAKQDARFVKKLHARGLPALVDAGTDHDARRILIGPFADRQALEKAQSKLQVFGVLALERSY